jgi:DNA-binding MarR family transcriptional regulator
MEKSDETNMMIDILYSMKENIRRKILDVIFTAGDDGISFKSIVQEGRIPPTTAAYHLKVLMKAGLVAKVFRNVESRRDYSFYHITRKGDRAFFIINEIFESTDLENGEEEYVPSLPDIQIIPLRIGPRCLMIDRIQG